MSEPVLRRFNVQLSLDPAMPTSEVCLADDAWAKLCLLAKAIRHEAMLANDLIAATNLADRILSESAPHPPTTQKEVE